MKTHGFYIPTYDGRFTRLMERKRAMFASKFENKELRGLSAIEKKFITRTDARGYTATARSGS